VTASRASAEPPRRTSTRGFFLPDVGLRRVGRR
jgi:hypothetical protein